MSDIVVIPSLQEGFGLIILEAMACEKPVIGTKVGGILDQIVNGYNGFLAQSRNLEEIAEKILWLIDNPEEAKRMGTNERRVVEEKFNIEKRIDRIISLILGYFKEWHSLLEEILACEMNRPFLPDLRFRSFQYGYAYRD